VHWSWDRISLAFDGKPATGAFYDDFRGRSQPFTDVVKKAEAITVGTITEAAMESETDNDAQVLVSGRNGRRRRSHQHCRHSARHHGQGQSRWLIYGFDPSKADPAPSVRAWCSRR
jgi:hypothetical protein